MALPKLDTPIHTLVLPSTGQEIKYRPFLVKEQKLLMMAQESEEDDQMYHIMSNIVRACTFDKVDADTVPLFDIEYVFLKLRAKSVGETAKLRVMCPDDEKTYTELEVNLDNIDVQMTENHTNIVELSDKVKIIMKYPQLKDMKMIGADLQGVEQVFSILKYCIHEVHDGEKVYNRIDVTEKDIEDFIESFSTTQLESVINFFDTMPKLRHTMTITNPKTKVKSDIVLEGLQSFLE
jgi:hypothetical protein|tara:strand:+ start:125 stop:832 length:708 start_codon:yes stop_codon:yes gene_type:complete